jgi:hypothetical protein
LASSATKIELQRASNWKVCQTAVGFALRQGYGLLSGFRPFAGKPAGCHAPNIVIILDFQTTVNDWARALLLCGKPFNRRTAGRNDL